MRKQHSQVKKILAMTEKDIDKISAVDVVIRTFNSDRLLQKCISSIRSLLPVNRLIVVDHYSSDRTVPIARSYGAEIYFEDRGLGYATSLGASLANTEYTLFIDSDVIVTNADFYRDAVKFFSDYRTGAVVGVERNHPFHYGLPLGLTLFKSEFIKSVDIPENTMGRETYFIQKAISRRKLKIKYLSDAMVHDSIYRSWNRWPEWQGAQIRFCAGLNPWQLVNSFFVVLLMHMNSKKPKNILYTPLFYLKLLRGFFFPFKWGYLDRRKIKLS